MSSSFNHCISPSLNHKNHRNRIIMNEENVNLDEIEHKEAEISEEDALFKSEISNFGGDSSFVGHTLKNFSKNLMPGVREITISILNQLLGSLKLTKPMIKGTNTTSLPYLDRSLKRALDRRLYLLIYGDAYGTPKGQPVWHLPEKMYNSEETLRKCAESALQSVIGDLSNTYFVGNAPMGHIATKPAEKNEDISSFTRFFFKSQVIATNKVNIKCKDFVWVTKDELLEYFPEHSNYLTKMIIS